MNYGPLEFEAWLHRRDEPKVESAEVLAARAAAPEMRPERDRLIIVSGPRRMARIASDARQEPVGVYEAIAGVVGEQGREADPVRVLVSPAFRPIVLVLSAHRPIAWQIELSPGANLLAVLIAGCGESRVAGVEESLVSSIGGFYAFRPGTLEYKHLEREILRCTGRGIQHFHSVYAGDTFEIP